MLGAVRVSCKRCAWQGERSESARHAERFCESYTCPNPGCDWRGTRVDQSAHQASCERFPCPHPGCEWTGRQDQVGPHAAKCLKSPHSRPQLADFLTPSLDDCVHIDVRRQWKTFVPRSMLVGPCPTSRLARLVHDADANAPIFLNCDPAAFQGVLRWFESGSLPLDPSRQLLCDIQALAEALEITPIVESIRIPVDPAEWATMKVCRGTHESLDLRSVQLTRVAGGTRFVRCRFSLSRIELSAELSFEDCDMRGCTIFWKKDAWQGAPLGARFVNCDLQGANLTSRSRPLTSFVSCNMRGCLVRGEISAQSCDLSEADLSNAQGGSLNLSHSNLRMARLPRSLCDAVLCSANMSGLDLREHILENGGRRANLDGAILDGTLLPSGFSAPSGGPSALPFAPFGTTFSAGRF